MKRKLICCLLIFSLILPISTAAEDTPGVNDTVSSPIAESEAAETLPTPEQESDIYAEPESEITEPETEAGKPTYTVSYPQNMPVAYNGSACALECPEIIYSENFTSKRLKISISFSGFFYGADTETPIPYRLFAILGSGEETELESGAELLFEPLSDGTLPQFGTLDEKTVTGLVVRFSDSAWEGLTPGEYATDIVFEEHVVQNEPGV